MSLATGVADDALRPALARLVISTGNTAKAQDLLSLALDASTATGKPLETVANALGKAYDGNTTALGKLGLGLSSAELKSMSFEQVQARLSDLFGGGISSTYGGSSVVEKNLDRITIVVGGVWFASVVALSLLLK
jgi:protein translocase SecG subunit